MSAPFAAFEARANQAVFARLANTSATVAGVVVEGIFDNAYQLGSVGQAGFASTQPVLTTATSGLPTDPVGQLAVVNGKNYTVAAHEPDGTGLSVLMLEAA